ncbi:alpha/beta fold hydrolase [Streptomyces ficellus]|uniref:Alpha/beta fold hydrolase n=1 Tax=Streptomyces ficellus TaxID=1977088 RepID=A0A6I6FUC7_9ACTN|nr:alpha/beta fold hydrolase [Streptomyces ficellus]QGV80976.1 alpha/beta fold hydrolase [Streptomyces ficellus]
MDTVMSDGERIHCVVRDPGGTADQTGAAGVTGVTGVTVVVLHGAGNGSAGLLVPVLDEFAARGCRVVAPDFSGHGRSSGDPDGLSLERRFVQARAVIDRIVPDGDDLVLVGFSMSGQTVADLVGHYGGRVRAIGLCAPAVYAREAWRVPFGHGFTEIIRREGGWRDTTALDTLRGYEGTAVLAVPGTDDVIPPDVTGAVEDALTARSRYRRLDVPGAGHRLGVWFVTAAEDRRRFADAVLAPPGTPAWVEKALPGGERVVSERWLTGGWTSQMRLLRTEGPALEAGPGPGREAGPVPGREVGPGPGREAGPGPGGGRDVVLRSFVKPFYRRHAPGLLAREADVLALLAGTGIPAPECLAVDATGEFCDAPSLLMTRLPGAVRVDEAGLDARAGLLARQLVRIHAVSVTEGTRPRPYQAWTSPERVRVPAGTSRPRVWARAVEVIGREAPAYEGVFLHRDFHPGNVLFSGAGADLRLSGVVDWVETSWGPADLDVAHCSTALALLHGVEHGLAFAGRYAAHGGVLSRDPEARLYWRLLDALAFAPDAEKVARPWRELGRTDLTPQLLAARLETYVAELLEGAGG